MSENAKRKPLSTEPYRGVRDFYPEDMEVQSYIFSVWKKVAEEFGYEEYAASLLEPAELYRAKGNEEIVSEQMFTFTDRGGREVALRPEMTPSLARMVAARRKSLKFPLRWFTIANCFRYERPQRGRRREHWQLNCDFIGEKNTVKAETEIILLAYDIMMAFEAKESDFEIRINDRRIFDVYAQDFGLSSEEKKHSIRLIDRYPKEPSILDTLPEGKIKDAMKEFVELSNAKKISDIKGSEHIQQLKEDLNKKDGFKNVRIVLDTSIARGFDYYTGMVFEVFDTHEENRRSLFGGGRYDNLLEIFGVEPIPTVGFGMGDITIRDFLGTHGLPPFANAKR